jgi:vacuolar-type H+-ATPase subunit C/Vma6
MLNDPDLGEVAQRAVGLVLDKMLSEAPTVTDTYASGDIERLAWRRLARLANRVFRRSHMGVAAVYASSVIRRLEVANLTTVSEGIRLGVDADKIRLRLLRP